MKVTRILQGSFFFPHNFHNFFFTIFFHKCLYVEIPQIFLFLLMYRKCKKMDGCYLNIIKKEKKVIERTIEKEKTYKDKILSILSSAWGVSGENLSL